MIIEDMRADYHRNGVGGAGSYVAMFRVTQADIGERIPFMGVFWNDDPEGNSDNPNQCMVMHCADVAEPLAHYLEGSTPEGLGSRKYPASMNMWRSTDYFLPHLIEPLKEAMKRKWTVARAEFDQEEDQASKTR